jgi:hypothetical protein
LPPKNYVCGFNENHTLLSLRTTRIKKQTQTIEPAQGRKKDQPKKFRDKAARYIQASENRLERGFEVVALG